jgi:hypothetical protein
VSKTEDVFTTVLSREPTGKGSSVTIEAPLGTTAFRIRQKFEADHPGFIGIISVDVTDSQKLQISCLSDNIDFANEGRKVLLETINFLRTNPITDRFYEER